MLTKKLSIGIIGTRGIPNQYGGYEAAVQELAPRLMAKGHEVVVYCSSLQTYKDSIWNGVKLIYQYDPENRIGSAGQFIYDLKCNISSRFQNHDVIFHMGYTSDSVWHWLWDSKARHITNMDGLEWKRSKYSQRVQKFLKKAEKLAAVKSNLLIADSIGILEYVQQKYNTPVLHIAYGVQIPNVFDEKRLAEYKLTPNKYDLLIARMVPENNIEMAIKAKNLSNVEDVPLVIFGNENSYGNKLKEEYKGNARIKFCNANYDKVLLDSLRHFSRYYIHGHSVGGTNPSLLEAMAAQSRVLAHNNVFNKGVLQQGGSYFNTADQLVELLNQDNPYAISLEQIAGNLKLLMEDYNWEIITNKYEEAAYHI